MNLPPSPYVCPVCGSTDVRRDKTGLPEGESGRSPNLIDFYCQSCQTFESRRDDAPDYHAWYERWLNRRSEGPAKG